MTTPSSARFGAIRWEPGVELEEAIRAVRAFQDPNEAIHFVARSCRPRDRWAVIDLTTMGVIAEGPRVSPPGTAA